METTARPRRPLGAIVGIAFFVLLGIGALDRPWAALLEVLR